MKKLITDVDKRLGYKGADEIRAHPFFKGVDWSNTRRSKPPFIPDISCEWDNRYFDQFEEDEPFYYDENVNNSKPNKDVCFINFNYKRDIDDQKINMVTAIEVLESLKKNIKKEEVADETWENNILNTEESVNIHHVVDRKQHISELPESSIKKGFQNKNMSLTKFNKDDSLSGGRIKLEDNNMSGSGIGIGKVNSLGLIQRFKISGKEIKKLKGESNIAEKKQAQPIQHPIGLQITGISANLNKALKVVF